jgi:hypothetical protein
MKIWIVKWFRPILLGIIAVVEFIIIYLNWPVIEPFLEDKSELKLLSTIIPILLSTPFAYSIWTWRDHDKQRIMNYDESRLALDTKKNNQETARWEHDIKRLEFEDRSREVDKQEENNKEIEMELKTTIIELSYELESLKKSGMIVPKINSNLDKFMKSAKQFKPSEDKTLGAINLWGEISKKNENLEKNWKSEEYRKLSEALEALKSIEALKAASLNNKDSEEHKKLLKAIEALKRIEALKVESLKNEDSEENKEALGALEFIKQQWTDKKNDE